MTVLTRLCSVLEYAICMHCLWFVGWAPFASKGLVKIQMLAGFVFLMVYAVLSRRIRTVSLVPRNRTGWYLLMFSFVLCLSAALSLDWYHSQKIVINRYGFYAGAFFLGCFCAGNARMRNWIPYVLIAGGIALGLGGIVDYLKAPGRLYTSWGIGLNMTPFLALFMPVLFTFLLLGSRNMRVSAAAAFLLLCPVLLWNGSRGAALALGIAFLALAAFHRQKVLYRAMAFLSVAAVLFIVVNGDRFLHVLNPHAWGNRVELWDSAAAIFLDFPLLGAGPGMYEKLLYLYAPFGNYSEGIIHLHAHNSYLELMAEIGLIGCCLFVFALVVFVRDAFEAFRHLDLSRKRIVLAVSGMVITGGLFAFVCTILIIGTQETAVFWFLWGMGIMLLNKNATERIS